MTANESQQIGALTADVANIKKQLEQQDEKLTEVYNMMLSTRGGWRVLLILGGALMAVTSFATGLVIKFWPGN